MIYAERVGAYGAENYLLMENFKNWLVLKELITDESIILGIAMDDVSTTPPDRCRYRVIYLADRL